MDFIKAEFELLLVIMPVVFLAPVLVYFFLHLSLLRLTKPSELTHFLWKLDLKFCLKQATFFNIANYEVHFSIFSAILWLPDNNNLLLWGMLKSFVVIRWNWNDMTTTYLDFCNMKKIRVSQLPLGWDISPSQGYPQQYVGKTQKAAWPST